MQRITTTDITKGLKIPFGRLREWIIRGYITPSFPSPGQGQAAEFTIEDVYKIKAFQQMVDGGLTREAAAFYLKAINDVDMKSCYAIVFTRLGQTARAKSIMLTENVSAVFKALNQVPLSVHSSPFPKSGEAWDDLYILNFEKIRESVDGAFVR